MTTTGRTARTLAALLLAPVCLGASDQEPQRPVFRSAVDLVTIAVVVVDEQGRPVPGLAPEDFDVRLDGVRRPVRTLDYRSTSAAVDRLAPRTDLRPPARSAADRTFLLLVDDLSYRASSSELPALRAAAQRMVSQLSPDDRVGFATTSGRSPGVAPTSDRNGVVAALRQVRGWAAELEIGGFYVSLLEAAEIVRSGRHGLTLTDVARRECELLNSEAIDICGEVIETQARMMLTETRNRTARQLQAYADTILSLSREPSPRILVLLSAGLANGAELGLSQDLTFLANAAAVANVQLYALLGDADDPTLSEAARTRVDARAADVAVLQAGIQHAAGAVGGALLRLVGEVDRAFDRVLRESSGVYELGVDAPAGAPDGLPEVVVDVRRPGVTVRANRRAVLPAVVAARPDPRDEVRLVLAEGRTAIGVPIAVAASSRRDPNGKDLQLAVDLALPDSVIAPLDLSFAIVDEDDRAVKTGAGRVTGPAKNGEHRFAFVVPLAPGRYRVRVAAVDPDGRVGGVEHPVSLELHEMGLFLASDLQTAWVDRQGARRFLALRRLPADAVSVDVGLELYPVRPEAVSAPAEVRVELAAVGAADTIATRTFDLPGGDRRAILASIPVERLPAGLFRVTATILDDGRPAGSLVTVLEKLDAPAEAPAAPVRPGLPTRAALLKALSDELHAVPPPFDRTLVLRPRVIRSALQSLVRSTGDEPVPALDAAAQSEDELWSAVAALARAPRSAAGALARGLLNLRLDNIAEAASQFQLALGRAIDSPAALRYAGAGHAASGRDEAAVRAWRQASELPDEDGTALEWRLLETDALVRLGSPAAAAGILRDLHNTFADAPGLLARLARLELAEGREREARPLVAALVAARPDDHELRWFELVLALADALETNDAAAAQRFRTLASRYLDVDGPRAGIVRGWLGAMSGGGNRIP